MQIVITPDYDSLSARAADEIALVLRAKPDAVLVVPTGNTPLGMFHELARRAAEGEIRFARAHLVELDEYWSIPLTDERNLYRWLDEVFISRVGFAPERVIRFNSQADDPQVELRRVAQAAERFGGIDVQVLGLGFNGHIGFNEPGSPFDAPTQLIELTPESVASNARYWGSADKVPRKGMTLGFGTLGRARQTILLVSGEDKADILARVLREPITPAVPATWLRTLPHVIIIADDAAAGKLSPLV